MYSMYMHLEHSCPHVELQNILAAKACYESAREKINGPTIYSHYFPEAMASWLKRFHSNICTAACSLINKTVLNPNDSRIIARVKVTSVFISSRKHVLHKSAW